MALDTFLGVDLAEIVDHLDVAIPQTGRALTQDVRHRVCKLVAERSRGEILGAQIMGPAADEIIHTLGAIMYGRGTAADMLRMPWYHPTHSEILLALARQLDARTDTT